MISSQIKTTQGTEERSKLSHAKKIVVKVGTHLVVNQNGGFNYGLMGEIASQIHDLLAEGKQVVLVTSGAIGLGNKLLGFEQNGDAVLNQSAAAVGQNLLMSYYFSCFKEYGIPISQLLLTNHDTANTESLKKMVEKQLDMGIVVVINENDPVSNQEITFGDNDILSAYVSNFVDADLLVILSEVDGLYQNLHTGNRISVVKKIHKEIECCVHESTSELGKGGMASKLNAAKIAGSATVVANGKEKDVLKKILGGDDIGTLFCANGGKNG